MTTRMHHLFVAAMGLSLGASLIEHATAQQPERERRSHPPAARLPGTKDISVPAPRGWPRGLPPTVQMNTTPEGMNIIGDAANEPSLAVDPTAPLRMAVGWRQFDSVTSSFRQAGYAYSRDGGRTWTFAGVIEPGAFRSDPVLRSNRSGTFFYNSYRFDDAEQAVHLFKSTDHGMTWGNRVNTRAGDKTWMAIDVGDGIGRDNIYQTWNSNSFNRSVDGGLTFGSFRSIAISSGGTVAVGAQGEVYISDVTGRVVKSTNAQDPMATPTFSLSQVDLGDPPQGGLPNPAGLLSQTWVDTDRSDGERRGWVYLCGAARTTADPSDVRFSSSPDGGQTWTPAITINNDPPMEQNWQWFITMGVAPNGRIDLVWNDTRAGQFNICETYYAWSNDGGVTWLGNIPIGPAWNSYHGWPMQSKIGDYYDIRSDLVGADLVYAATYNFNEDRGQGEQDVYYVRLGEHDCNVNGVGDETEIASNPALDCNGNGIVDSCEIAAATATDVNHNGLLDACECLADWDGNGVVDSADLFAFLDAFLSKSVDLNSDGFVDSRDFFDFMVVFLTGC